MIETRLAELSSERRALLEKLLKEREAAGRKPAALTRRWNSTAPLSFAQQRLWVLDQLAPGSIFYVETHVLPFRWKLDIEALKRSINEVIRRHEILRTNFRVVNGEPSQVINPQLVLQMPVLDLRSLAAADRAATIARLAIEDARHIADISRDALVRATLLSFADDDNILLWNMHHIVCDGWSMGILVWEITTLYRAFAEGKPSPLPELPVQYSDYAAWQREWLTGDVLAGQLDYWKKQLDGIPGVELPADHPRPPVQSYRGATREFIVEERTYVALKELSKREGVTLFMTLLAAFNVLIYRYTGQEDLVVGVPISSRNRSELGGLIGFFVNTLVMRNAVSGDLTFIEFLARVRDTALAAYAHQDLPFERLVEELQPERDMSRNPLFQVVFQLFSALNSAGIAPEQMLDVHRVDIGTAKFDLRFDLLERAARLDGYFEYSTDLFEAATIDAMVDHFVTLLESIVRHPDARIRELRMMTAAEEKRVLIDWNRTEAPYPEVCVHRLVECQAAERPDMIALQDARARITYGELNRQAERVAARLLSLRVRPNVPVPVCIERSAEWVVALLGVLKAGGAYAPIDPSYPRQRIEAMLSDLSAPVVLTRELIAEWTSADSASHPVEQTPTHEDLAYIIYTSGSTGTPRGVEIRHRGLANLVAWHNRTYAVRPDDRGTLVSSPAFDASVWELWPYLAAGATVVVADSAAVAFPSKLIEWLINERITISFLPTPLAEAVLSDPRSSELPIRSLLTGGDKFHAFENAELPFSVVNHYGPTENTVVATCATIRPNGTPPPIGRPISNVTIYVLDRDSNPVPAGIPGELYIGGLGLARGFFNRPDLTAEKFVSVPSIAGLATRLYRTGDLVRYRRDGNLAFIGRLDDQVKVRGFRIELAEIESTLRSHPAVIDAVVVPHEEGGGERRLAAYVVPSREIDAAGPRKRHIGLWQKMFDSVIAGNSEASADPKFNIAGWNSSYTGLPIPAEELREQVDHTVARITDLKPKRVLEIGSGTGLLLFRLAPACERYVGTDFSPESLSFVRRRLDRDSLHHVELVERTADDFSGFKPDSFDTAILNSVVQYFPDRDYLLQVLERAINVVGEGGHIFVGDVRSLPLLEAFHTSVELERSGDGMSVEDLRARVRERMAEETELVIDPRLFYYLKQRSPRIRSVEIQPRRGTFRNELTLFRYDVILEIGESGSEPAKIEIRSWDSIRTLEKLRLWLAELGERPLVVRHIPSARTEIEIRAVELLAHPAEFENVGALRQEISRTATAGIDPEQLWALGQEFGCRVRVTFSLDRAGCYDVAFSRSAVDCFGHLYGIGETTTALTNAPLQRDRAERLIPDLRKHLQQKLPEYMVPSAFVLLDAIPVTPNGKVDKRSLPPLGQARRQVAERFITPGTPTERMLAAAWQEVLGIDRVGVDDNFFDLGGHSLLLVRLHARLKEMMDVGDSLVDLFRYPTISSFARFLEQRSGDTALAWREAARG